MKQRPHVLGTSLQGYLFSAVQSGAPEHTAGRWEEKIEERGEGKRRGEEERGRGEGKRRGEEERGRGEGKRRGEEERGRGEGKRRVEEERGEGKRRGEEENKCVNSFCSCIK